MRIPWSLIGILLAACSPMDGLELASDWRAEPISYAGFARPDMQVLVDHVLLQSCETTAVMHAPSLVRIDLKTGRRVVLLRGLARADALKLAPDGSLWIGEETSDGRVWRIDRPLHLPPDQRIVRRRWASHPAIRPVPAAGRFAHEGMAFSSDGRYLYLADEWRQGCIYRLKRRNRQLQVLHATKGWLDIPKPAQARRWAQRLHGRIFDRIEDMETLPDGRVVMAETGTGRLWVLDDRGGKPKLEPFLKPAGIRHPDNLAWDTRRGWLWITDDASPSSLWAWDGARLQRIAMHEKAEITGVIVGDDGIVYVNLQHTPWAGGATLRLEPR